ncbi:uncharacterized protein OCT59_012502 [Rhizophagus irregularis]|nr:hypothetical protein OCT59_012502 [Rhizophagus irregularis]
MSSQCIIYTVMCSPYWTQNFERNHFSINGTAFEGI